MPTFKFLASDPKDVFSKGRKGDGKPLQQDLPSLGDGAGTEGTHRQNCVGTEVLGILLPHPSLAYPRPTSPVNTQQGSSNTHPAGWRENSELRVHTVPRIHVEQFTTSVSPAPGVSDASVLC